MSVNRLKHVKRGQFRYVADKMSQPTNRKFRL